MKFKINFDPNKIIWFVAIAIALLYLIAIAVLNLHTFSMFGYFCGFNPFPAFGPNYIGATITFYILTMVALFSVASGKSITYEKGIGFSAKKKEDKGYSHWMDEKAMKNEGDIKKVVLASPTSDAAGIPIINNGTEAWVDNGENHSLIIGASGSGKTQCIMFPYIKILAKKGESMVITDPKGEIYEDTAELLKNNGYKVILINFRDPKNGAAWNPFALPYRLYKEGNTDKAKELLEDLAANILHDNSGNNDPFWERSAGDFFTGLALGLFEDATENQVNLNSINYMSTIGEEKIGPKTILQEYFTAKGELSSAYISASNTVNAPSETKGGILSVFRQKIRIFSSREVLSEMLSHNDFELRDIGREKTAVFLKIHDEKTTYHALATIFVKQVYESLIDVAQEQENLKLKYRTNFVLDEFANMPPLKDVESMITASRSRNIRFSFVIQNFSQLTKVYGKDIAETIKGNCGNIVFLITTELAALEEISKLCGDVKPKESKDKPAEPIRPLVTVSDLQQMKKFEVLIKRFRNYPFKTKFKPNYEIDWGDKFPKASYPYREMREIEVFDIKKFVLDKRRENMNNSANPFMQFNPQATPFANPMMYQNPNPIPMNPQNIDDIVKKIDEKIAQLEKEEEEERNKSELQTVHVNPLAEKIEQKASIINNQRSTPIVQIPDEKPTTSISPFSDDSDEVKTVNTIEEKEEVNAPQEIVSAKPKIKVDTDSVIVKDEITDDEFFDDFFGDE